MISMDKNLMTTVGVAVCLLVTIYLFKDYGTIVIANEDMLRYAK